MAPAPAAADAGHEQVTIDAKVIRWNPDGGSAVRAHACDM